MKLASVSLVVALSLSIGGALRPARAAEKLSVQQAYDWIPHARTQFDPKQGKMDAARKAFLESLFRWVDEAVVARVSALQAFKRSAPAPWLDERYSAILSGMGALKDPGDGRLLTSVREAIELQRDFLKEWNAAVVAGRPYEFAFEPGKPQSPKVGASSQRLHEAYGLLMSAYPQEGAINKQAFFDHLCALDFI